MRKLSSTVRLVAVFALALIMLAGCVMQATTYTVNFNTDGGTYIPSAQVQQNQTVAEPTPPTKDGYTFAGWYKQGSSTPFSFATKITSNITLVARWTANSSQGGGDNTGTQTTTAVVSTTHMDVQGCAQGIKITLKTGVRDAGIHVFYGNDELPVHLETNNEENVYYFPFTESGKQYTVKLDGVNTATDEWFGGDEGDHPFETATVTALGGSKLDDCISFNKIMSSTLVGEIDTSAANNSKYKVKLSSTQVNNPSDIVKNSNLVKRIEFEFILCLGDDDIVGREDWWSGCGFDISSTQNDNSLGNTLKTFRDLPVSNWHGANENNGVLTADRYEEYFHTYKFRARMKFQAGSEGTTYNGRFVTNRDIESAPHSYSPDAAGDNNVRVLAWPQMENLSHAQHGTPPNMSVAKNHIEAQPSNNSPATFEIPLNAIKYGEDGATFSTWSQYDTMTITLQKSEDHEIMVYAKDTSSGDIQELASFDGGSWEHQSQTIFIEDLNSFFESHSTAAANKAIMLRVNEECLIKIASIKFQKYDHSTQDFVIFDPESSNVANYNFGSNAHLVTLDDGHKYLKVTTASVITGQDTSDTVVNLPTKNVPAGYMRIKAYCFVTDDKHTTSTSASNYYMFAFLLGDTDWNSASFMQRPLFDTNVNYKGNTSVDNQMRCQNGLPSESFPVNKLWVWANNGKYTEDRFTQANDFADLPNKEFYIGKIVAYTPTDTN